MNTETDISQFDPEKAVDEITEFISEKVEEANAEGVVIGLSGGIDSTLSATLAVEALGPEMVTGLIMPSETTTGENESDAEYLAESLGISYEVVEIQPIVDSFASALTEAAEDKKALGNVSARARMVLSYMKANSESKIVLGTGNRTELLIGYYTKYGDGGVDILPIGDLYKTEVRELSRHLGVDERFIEKPPTAGLWEGQTDEDELGASYETIDAVLRRLIDRDKSVGETAKELDVDTELVEKFETMYRRSEHKRKMPPYPEIQN